MNRFVFAALMTFAGPALAPVRPPSQHATREPQLVTRMVPTPALTWTCTRNTYRSVACP
jgi:hypothetical protein